MNIDLRVHDLLHAQLWHFVLGGEVHGDRVAGAGHLVGFTLDVEGGFEAVPLCGELLAAGCVGEGVGEGGVVLDIINIHAAVPLR